MKQTSMNTLNNRAQGFTLIEILVVVVILGILGTIVVQTVIKEPGKAKIAAAKVELRSIENAADRYKLEHHDYPSTDQGIEALVPEYLRRLPKDPWGNPYKYLSPGSHGDVDIYTLGGDGQPGGEGEDADIGNWDQ